jgi:hypothetical protein
MLLAGFLFFILFKKKTFRIPLKSFLTLTFVGFLIAMHWVTFFHAIHVSNVSITLSVFSLGLFCLYFRAAFLWSKGIVVRGFGLIIAGLNDHASRGELSDA